MMKYKDRVFAVLEAIAVFLQAEQMMWAAAADAVKDNVEEHKGGSGHI